MQEYKIRVLLQYMVKRTIMNLLITQFSPPSCHILLFLSSEFMASSHTPEKCSLYDHHHKNLKSDIINSMHIPGISVILQYQESRNLELHHCVHKSFTLHSLLRQANLFYISSTYILKNKLPTIHPSTSRSPK